MWDERYSRDDYLFGTAPAAFLEAHADPLKAGQSALAVADGEGRNSVFLAKKGLEVTAMDSSRVGVDKARRLADECDVSVDFHVTDILNWEWTPGTYDVVLAVFIQFLSPNERPPVFEGMRRTLKEGGLLLLHGYRPEQVDYATGGPPYRENMYTEDLLRDAFADLSIERLAAYDAVIEEGLRNAPDYDPGTNLPARSSAPHVLSCRNKPPERRSSRSEGWYPSQSSLAGKPCLLTSLTRPSHNSLYFGGPNLTHKGNLAHGRL